MFTAVLMPQPSAFAPEKNSAFLGLSMSPFRPSRPSPLASSPMRAVSPAMDAACEARPSQGSSAICSSPPQSQYSSSSRHERADTQSSPVQPSFSSPFSSAAPIFSLNSAYPQPQQQPQQAQQTNDTSRLLRFASRQAKAPPRQSRDAMRQTRRSLFLRNVRQRADDQAWDRRNCEQEVQKLEWWALEREIRQAKEADSLNLLAESDFDDAAEWSQQRSSALEYPNYSYGYDDDDMDEDDDVDEDERMADLLACEEEAELESFMVSMDAGPNTNLETAGQQQRPPSGNFIDDSDYDVLFAEFLAGQSQDHAMDTA